MKLSDKKWNSFFIGGKEGIFEVTSTSSGVDKNKLINGEGDIPYITRTETNNGINLFISEKQQEKYKMDSENVITIGLDTQTVFYQPYKFYTGQNIQILRNENLNKYNALFIIPLLKIQMEKFNWGGNGATLGRLVRTKIMLPVLDSDINTPDWEYMENYVREQESLKIKEYTDYIKNEVKSIRCKRIEKLSNKRWKAFFIDDIFTISPGKRLTKKDMIAGNRPFIGATESNNGITNFVSNVNASLDKNVLGVNYNGSVCETFYHPYECIFSDDVKRFSLKDIEGNKYIYLFFKAIILKQKPKYTYGYKFNEQRMKKQYIMVPVTDDDKPDYEYMEQYIKNLMITKYNEYLSYSEQKIINQV